MCGIAGIVDFDRKPVEPGLLLAMNQAIMHRGPDDEGYVIINPVTAQYRSYCGAISPAEIKQQLPAISAAGVVAGASIGLSHRRFSIIDLSAAAHQPCFFPEK
jgi:asparagine synthase (glutamine-hydrolysing)